MPAEENAHMVFTFYRFLCKDRENGFFIFKMKQYDETTLLCNCIVAAQFFCA